MRSRKTWRSVMPRICIMAVLLTGSPAAADEIADFYSGKQLKLIRNASWRR